MECKIYGELRIYIKQDCTSIIQSRVDEVCHTKGIDVKFTFTVYL